MLKLEAIAIGLSATVVFGAGASAQSTISGRIKSFECGDNCYLAITTDAGKALQAMCEAPQCEPWFENQEMPARFKGKRVNLTLGKGVQRDGEGRAMGTITSIKKIQFLD